jgi:hypothetical protein
MPGLFPNPSAAPEAFKPGDQVRWYVGDAHISPYVGVVIHVHPGIQKVDVDFPVGGVQRMAPEDLILITRFVGETTVAPDGGDYSGYDKSRSDESYGTFRQNLREMARNVASKKASIDGKSMASVIAERFAADVVDGLADDLCACSSKGLTDIEAYQSVYPKYASKCSDAFLRGAVRRVYAATQGKWTVNNTELNTWFERDRASIILEDKASGKSIMEWWDEGVKEAQDDGFLGSDQRKWHEEAVDYANERGLKPQSSDKWHKAFQDDEKYRKGESEREESESFMSEMASKAGIKNPKVDVNTHVKKVSVAVDGVDKVVVQKLLNMLEEADVDAKEEKIPVWVDNSKQVNQVVSTGIDDIVYRRR